MAAIGVASHDHRQMALQPRKETHKKCAVRPATRLSIRRSRAGAAGISTPASPGDAGSTMSQDVRVLGMTRDTDAISLQRRVFDGVGRAFGIAGRRWIGQRRTAADALWYRCFARSCMKARRYRREIEAGALRSVTCRRLADSRLWQLHDAPLVGRTGTGLPLSTQSTVAVVSRHSWRCGRRWPSCCNPMCVV